MDWSGWAAVGSFVVSALLVFDKFTGRLMGRYVTREELHAVARSASDGLILESRARSDLTAEFKVMATEMRHLPTSDDVTELKDRVAGIDRGQALTQQQLGNVEKSIESMRASLDRVADELRRRP